jgi:hypothetical protein
MIPKTTLPPIYQQIPLWGSATMSPWQTAGASTWL